MPVKLTLLAYWHRKQHRAARKNREKTASDVAYCKWIYP